MLLVISNSGHYIWYIYLYFAVTQTDDCELGLNFCWCVEDWEVSSLQFLLVSRKLKIVEQSCTLPGHFSLTSCHVLTAKYPNYLLSYSGFFWHILLYKYSIQYFSWLIIMSSLTQQLFNSLGMINDYLQEMTWCWMFLPTKYYLKR